MKKDKKRGVAAKPGVSPETSRTPLKADLDPDFLEVVRAMDKAERKEIGDLIDAVCKSFGFPHEHKGLGLRDLGHAFYECRMGLQQRIVFEKTANGLYFHILGDHNQVKRFLKRNF
jgi:hypothetical protein